MANFKYCANNEAAVYESVSPAGKGVKTINRILLGSYLGILDQQGDWFQVKPFGTLGWMHKKDLTDEQALKIFYLDVGQGDGALLELGNFRILIDAGAGNNMYNYLIKFHFKSFLSRGEKVHIHLLAVSHFDRDHFKGFTKLINDERFTFGKICHAGILKFSQTGNPYNTGLGDKISFGGKNYLTKIFDDLITADEPAKFNMDVKPFVDAVRKAKAEGPLGSTERCRAGDLLIKKTVDGKTFSIEALAPFLETVNGNQCCQYWTNDGVTVNGHSLVLKVKFGDRTYLFGGDLNEKSQDYLLGKYGAQNPFEVDVAKSCHHGSQDFSLDFIAKVNPFATVISSGDNESYSHPRADAVGCAGRFSRGTKPLVFSTELARSTNIKTSKILFGMINSRCDGKRIFFSQMKESKRPSDLWDSYEIEF